MNSVEFTKCDICGKQDVVLRQYYYYRIPCECCIGDRHFEIVRYCKECTPVPPRRISAVVQLDPEQV